MFTKLELGAMYVDKMFCFKISFISRGNGYGLLSLSESVDHAIQITRFVPDKIQLFVNKRERPTFNVLIV